MRLLVLLFIVSATTAAQAQFVALFASPNFEGKHVVIAHDWNCEDADFCYDIESIMVPDGWQVWCYTQAGFKGDALKLDCNWAGTDANAWKWRNRIRSVRIVQSYVGMSQNNIGAALFRNRNLEGDHVFVDADWNGESNRDFCYDIESIFVPEGWEVWAYTSNDFSGSPLRLTSSWDGNGASDWQWRNRIRSVRMVRSFWTSPYGPRFIKEAGVALFSDRGLQGNHIFVGDDWTAETGDPMCYDIESIFVPNGWSVWVYTGKNWTGEYRILNYSWDGNGDNDWQWRNRIQSIRIAAHNAFRSEWEPFDGELDARYQAPEADVPVVVAYEHAFEGRSKMLTCDWTIGGSNGFDFNDIISSITVPSGMKVIVYEHANFEGRSLEITGNWTPPSWDHFWNDRISSIRIVRY